MSVIPAGGRLALRSGPTTVSLRVLEDTSLDGDWRIPVLAGARALEVAGGEVELPGDGGVLRCTAHLALEDGRLVLRRDDGSERAPVLLQRRRDVRGPVHLPVRGTVLGNRDGDEPEEAAFEGVTLSVSAGGLAVQLMPDMAAVLESAPPRPSHPGGTATTRLYLELELPNGPLVPAVVSLVRVQPHGLHGHLDAVRGAFLDIAAADRERLVGLVFAEERRMLARRSRGGGPKGRW